MSELPSGWGFPALAKKAHYFPTGDIESICGRWWYTGPRGAIWETRYTCTVCRKKLQETP